MACRRDGREIWLPTSDLGPMQILVSTHSSLPPEPSLEGRGALEAIVRRQEQVGVDVVTDGLLASGDVVQRFLGCLEATGDGRWDRREPGFAEDVRALRALTTETVKAVLPGPFSVATAVVPGGHPAARFEEVALQMAELIAAEVAEVVAAGAAVV